MRRTLAAIILTLLLGASLVPAQAAPGVTSTTIKIGIHAPLTGASPVASGSVEKGKDLYFRWLEEQGQSIDGRDVQVVLKNDQYNPSTAVAVCKEMVEKDKVFMLFGLAGADQITACARYAASVGVPYVSPGVSTTRVKKLSNYFALSMTWPAQGRLLADYFVSRQLARSKKNGVLYFDTPTWSEPIASFRNTLARLNADLDYDRSVPHTSGATQAQTSVQEMKLGGIENVFVNSTPVWFLQLLKDADAQEFRPTWMGIDSGMAKDTVARVACRSGDSLDGAKFFSSYPGVSESNRFDPDFRRAVNKFYPEATPDDYMWQLWAIDKAIAKMLRLPGSRLTRDRFIARVERADIRTGILPVLRYSPRDHFGAKATHVLEARCADQQWHTVATFKSDF